ncbi:MAG: single-stranded DNA-binding protein [bacterium]|nr:single-stranded DNA-binding protein [bacterium]
MVAKNSVANQVLEASATLCDAVDRLKFTDPVAYVYNPLRYAWSMHEKYIRTWGDSRRKVLMLGMNPGPWGMAQTGVPFGEISMVKEFMGLSGSVGKPDPEHPKRPVLGMESTRSEVSGRRLWGFFGEKFGGAEGFFKENIVVNYCPLVFMEDSARNRTPDKLPKEESAPLFAACDERLVALVDIYQPDWVVGVGGFARKKLDSLFGPKSPRGKGVLETGHLPGNIGTVLHPSPASPAANRGWAEAAQKQMVEQGVWGG